MLGRLTRWLRRTHPDSRDIKPAGNELGWAVREISGEARHPNHPPAPQRPTADDRSTPR
jgi:hypothetical protein